MCFVTHIMGTLESICYYGSIFFGTLAIMVLISESNKPEVLEIKKPGLLPAPSIIDTRDRKIPEVIDEYADMPPLADDSHHYDVNSRIANAAAHGRHHLFLD